MKSGAAVKFTMSLWPAVRTQRRGRSSRAYVISPLWSCAYSALQQAEEPNGLHRLGTPRPAY